MSNYGADRREWIQDQGRNPDTYDMENALERFEQVIPTINKIDEQLDRIEKEVNEFGKFIGHVYVVVLFVMLGSAGIGVVHVVTAVYRFFFG